MEEEFSNFANALRTKGGQRLPQYDVSFVGVVRQAARQAETELSETHLLQKTEQMQGLCGVRCRGAL